MVGSPSVTLGETMIVSADQGSPVKKKSVESGTVSRMRLDRWLKGARLFKTRTGAKRACEDGRVKIGRRRAKPASSIGVGDSISITRRGKVVFYEILEITSRSLPASRAAQLYREKEIVEKKGNALMKLIEKAEARYGTGERKGRPTKKERRKIDKLRGQL